MTSLNKKTHTVLSIIALLCSMTLLSGCKKTSPESSASSQKDYASALVNASHPASTASSASDPVSEPSSPETPVSTDTPTQPSVPQYSSSDKDTVNAPSGEFIRIPSILEALSSFSEISNKTPEGSPEEIVQTLLERNVLCFSAIQCKCWTFDDEYAENYRYMRGTAPVKSSYLTSTEQIDDLFYGTYIESKADYLIHYFDGTTTDAFTDTANGLRFDFSMVLKVAQDSFSIPTYASVISASGNEIVFERYYEPDASAAGKKPNNCTFRAVKRNGKWRLEYYITDAPAYEQQYTNLIRTGRVGYPGIVDIAKQEVGGFGGEPYWSWYGFDYRIEWCAAFVSWCYSEAGKDKPYFIACNSEGIKWFKENDRWAEPDYRDIAPGDSIFFDWDLDGSANHVGLVIGTDGKKVYTIEGNRSDACRAFSYDLDDERIFGYGLMDF